MRLSGSYSGESEAVLLHFLALYGADLGLKIVNRKNGICFASAVGKCQDLM
jgi:hypothetical protein